MTDFKTRGLLPTLLITFLLASVPEEIFVGSASAATWSEWKYLGGIVKTGLDATASAYNRLDVVGVGTDGRVYHKSWNGAAWSSWSNRGSPCLAGWTDCTVRSAPAITSPAPGQLVVVVVGANGQIFERWMTAGVWRNWTQLNPGATEAPITKVDILSRTVGQMDLIVVGGHAYLARYSAAAWTGWTTELTPQGAAERIIDAALAELPNWDLRAYVVTDETTCCTQLHHADRSDATGNWQGPTRDYADAWGIDAVGDTRDTWVVSKSSSGLRISQVNCCPTALGWSSSAVDPAIASWGPGRVDVFVADSTGAVWHRHTIA